MTTRREMNLELRDIQSVIKQIERQANRLDKHLAKSSDRSYGITRIQEGIMWLKKREEFLRNELEVTKETIKLK